MGDWTLAWTLLKNNFHGGILTITGFGDDYILITINNDCPGCFRYGGGTKKLRELLKDVNVIFINIHGNCDPYWTENPRHLNIPEEDARKIFPKCPKRKSATDQDSRVPATMDEVVKKMKELGIEVFYFQKSNSPWFEPNWENLDYLKLKYSINPPRR